MPKALACLSSPTATLTRMTNLRLTISRFDRVTIARTQIDEAAYLMEAKRGHYNQARVILRNAKTQPGVYELWTSNAIFSLESRPDDDSRTMH